MEKQLRVTGNQFFPIPTLIASFLNANFGCSKTFSPSFFQDTSVKDTDSWWQFSGAVKELNEIHTRILFGLVTLVTKLNLGTNCWSFLKMDGTRKHDSSLVSLIPSQLMHSVTSAWEWFLLWNKFNSLIALFTPMVPLYAVILRLGWIGFKSFQVLISVAHAITKIIFKSSVTQLEEIFASKYNWFFDSPSAAMSKWWKLSGRNKATECLMWHQPQVCLIPYSCVTWTCS